MPRTARTTALLLLVASGPWLVGCGDDEPAEATPTPIVIPGSTVTIGTEAGPVPSVAPTSREPSEPPTSEPTRSVADPGSVAGVDDLLAVVAGAVQGLRSVHLSVGTETGSVIEADHRYAEGDDYVAVLRVSAEPIEARRVGGAFYLRAAPDEPFAEVAADQPLEGVLGALRTWDVVGDLAAALTGVTGFTVVGPGDVDGTAVRTFAWTVDAAGLVASATVPDELTGPVEVTVSVDAEGLPVRVDERFVDSDQLLRTDYSAWGEPVEVAAP